MAFGNDPFFQGSRPPNIFVQDPFWNARGHVNVPHHPHSLALSPFAGGHMMMPFGGGASPFGMMDNMMRNMHSAMRGMDQRAANGQCYSSSSTTVMQYSSTGDGGRPRVYQASTSTRQGPGGIKETRKAVKDSTTGEQKMAVGHHIGDRSHVIERRVNTISGDREENQEFINLDETDANSFSQEWRQKTRSATQPHTAMLGAAQRHHLSNSRGLPSTSAHHSLPSEVSSSHHQRHAHSHPQTHGGAPHTHGGAPHTHGGAPQSHVGAPHTHVGAPHTHGGAPQSHVGAPHTHVGAPHTHVSTGKRKQRTVSFSKEEEEEEEEKHTRQARTTRPYKHVRVDTPSYGAGWIDHTHQKPHSQNQEEEPSKNKHPK